MDAELKKQVADWMAGGASVAEIHKRLEAQSRLNLSRLDVRILVSDLECGTAQPASQSVSAPTTELLEQNGAIGNLEKGHRATFLRRCKNALMPVSFRWLLCIPVGLCLWFIHHRYEEDKPHSIDVADARKHIGEESFVIGEVFGIKHLGDGKVLVDFGDFHPRQNFTAVFTPEAYADVREEHGGIKLGDVVSVHGVIKSFEGHPQMVIGCAGDVISESDIQSEAAWSDR
jgi:hypothetical protein